MRAKSVMFSRSSPCSEEPRRFLRGRSPAASPQQQRQEATKCRASGDTKNINPPPAKSGSGRKPDLSMGIYLASVRLCAQKNPEEPHPRCGGVHYAAGWSQHLCGGLEPTFA
ncbi:hypothetical protein TNCV_1781831 [Trichonephila clavipes]|nr:hypothetical protein TNCV_1781831 [Trichonephila clavipes]